MNTFKAIIHAIKRLDGDNYLLEVSYSSNQNTSFELTVEGGGAGQIACVTDPNKVYGQIFGEDCRYTRMFYGPVLKFHKGVEVDFPICIATLE